LAREWAYDRDVEDQLSEVLRDLEAAMLERSEAFNGRHLRGAPRGEADPAPAPDSRGRPSNGFAHREIGPDLALEMCWRQLSNSDLETRAKAEEFMKRKQEAAAAPTRSIVEKYLR